MRLQIDVNKQREAELQKLRRELEEAKVQGEARGHLDHAAKGKV